MNAEEITDLIGAVYEAPLDPRQWGVVVSRLRRATFSRQAHLFATRLHKSVGEFTSSQEIYLGFDNDDISLVDIARLGKQVRVAELFDPHMLRFNPADAGRTFFTGEIVPPDEYRASDFYNEFARRFDCFQGLAAVMTPPGRSLFALALYRSDTQPLYGERDKRLLDTLIPHLQRSLTLYCRLEAAETQTSIFRGSLDALVSAVALLDRCGKVIYLNAAAERLLKHFPDLYMRRDRLCATRHSDTLKLERLIGRATGAEGKRPWGGAVTVRRGLGEEPLQVAAAPIPLDRRSMVMSGIGAVAMLVIQDPQQRPAVPQETIAAMFGLTPAETRLLAALSNGQSLRQYCDKSRVSQNTARTHLKSLFAKTRATKQSDLVRLLSGFAHSVALPERPFD